ncbi:hypothetical protein RJ640_025167, partial [Escallonia rubra]
YKSLDVKNILLETMSHQILPQMIVSPLWSDLDDLLKDYLKFMDDHFRESADLTFLAYRHRNYSKVIEFVQFKERLQRSSQYLMAKIEAPILQLKQNVDSIEVEERVLEGLKCGTDFLELSREIGCKSLTFNEDLKLRPWWTPTSDRNYLLGPFEGVSYCPRENLVWKNTLFCCSLPSKYLKENLLSVGQQNQIEQSKTNVPKSMERRSLLPRMIYLSMQCASSSVKENVEANGSLYDPKVSFELKMLLECYAKILGFPFQDAVELVFGVLCGQKSSEVLSTDLVDWINFVVFLNAWDLNCHGLELPDRNASRPGTWHLVNSFLERFILEKLRSMGPLISSPGSDLPIVVQLITEPLAWHGLIIQSCVRSSLPSGRKKKKGGPADHLNSQISQEIRDSIQSVCGLLEEVMKWLREQVDKTVDQNVETILSSLQTEEGPGKVLQTLETLLRSMNDIELGERISQSLKAWSPVNVARKIVTGQGTVLSEFLKICKSKEAMVVYSKHSVKPWCNALFLGLILAFMASLASAETHYHEFNVQATPVKRLCKTRNIITVNGQFPGPTLEVRNGDTLVIKVLNSARYNATIHCKKDEAMRRPTKEALAIRRYYHCSRRRRSFDGGEVALAAGDFTERVVRHGIRQMRTPWADGPSYVTQCPIQPGATYTYRFKIEKQEGTLWWHAHTGWLRATVYGALIIRPKMGEWWNRNIVDVMRQAVFTGAAPNVSDAYTINGQPGDLYGCSSKDTEKFSVASGETILLRVINAALNQELFFSVANHKLTVVGADAAYNKPFTTSVIMLGPGQTTNVLLTADQSPGRYYMAASPYHTAQNAAFDNTTTTAILEYESAPCSSGFSSKPTLPRLPAYNDTATVTAFTNQLKSPSTVNVPTEIDENLFFTVGLGVVNCNPGPRCQGPNNTRVAASMNNISFVLPRTSLLQAYYQNIPGVYTADFPPVPPRQFDYTGNVSRALWQPIFKTKLYKLKYGSKVQIVLQDTAIISTEDHPIHLHGYHFYVVGQGFGNFNPGRDASKFNLIDPPQRNTINVPVGGWSVIRFVADNPGRCQSLLHNTCSPVCFHNYRPSEVLDIINLPGSKTGVWLMHCHIDSHLTWGLAMNFLVENGVGESQSIESPPADLPPC